MFRYTFVFLISVFITNTSIADCSNDLLGAKYKMTTSVVQGKHSHVTYMTLWRNGAQVAHQHTDSHVTEVWERIKNGQMRMVKNFDEYKRGIEYEPNEIKMKHNESGWQLKNKLVTQQLIESMNLKSSSRHGCDMLQTYEKEGADRNLYLQWLPQQQLVKKFTVVSRKRKITWKLESVIHDKEQVKKAI